MSTKNNLVNTQHILELKSKQFIPGFINLIAMSKKKKGIRFIGSFFKFKI